MTGLERAEPSFVSLTVRQIDRFLVGLTLCASLAGFIFTHPAIHWLLLCLPLVGVAIVVGTGYIYRFDSNAETDPRGRPVIALLFMAPPIALLVLCAHLHFEKVDDHHELAMGATLLLWLPMAIRLERPFRWNLLLHVVGLLLLFLYSMTAVFSVNVLLDRSKPTFSRARLIDKYITTGNKNRAAVFRLSLPPELSSDPLHPVIVNGTFYNAFAVGDDLCIRARTGALKIRYFELDHCPPPLPRN